jgi:restriction endonuclease S subunit
MTWKTKNIGDVCDLMTVGTPSRSKKEYFDNGKINWLVSGDVNMKIITKCKGKITEDGLANSNSKYLPLNSVVIALNGQGKTRGAVAMLKIKATCNQSLVSIFPKDLKMISSEYLYYNLDSRYDEMRKITGDSGNDRRGLNMPLLRNIDISFPDSLEEQKQVVKVLDEAFESISKSKESAEKNLNNAKELFESYLEGVFSNPGGDWEEKTLGEVVEINPKKSEIKDIPADEIVSFLPMKDLGVLQKETTPVKEKQLSEVAGSYTYFAENDVLLAKVTPCFENGKLGIAKSLKNGIGFGSSEYIVLRSSSRIIPEYLFYLLSQNKFRDSGKKLMFGACGLKRLSKEYIQNTPIPFPSILEQKTIVSKLDALSKQTKELESIYKQKIKSLDELKKSILQKAFAGELTK